MDHWKPWKPILILQAANPHPVVERQRASNELEYNKITGVLCSCVNATFENESNHSHDHGQVHRGHPYENQLLDFCQEIPLASVIIPPNT